MSTRAERAEARRAAEAVRLLQLREAGPSSRWSGLPGSSDGWHGAEVDFYEADGKRVCEPPGACPTWRLRWLSAHLLPELAEAALQLGRQTQPFTFGVDMSHEEARVMNAVNLDVLRGGIQKTLRMCIDRLNASNPLMCAMVPSSDTADAFAWGMQAMRFDFPIGRLR